MSIVTKRGDKGRTSLYKGSPVSKDHIRIEVCGTLDELCSCLGMSKSLAKDNRIKEIIRSIQEDLFIIGAEVATEPYFVKKLKRRIDDAYVHRIERLIERAETEKAFDVCSFCLPGEDLVSSTLDMARAIARKAERRMVSLKNRNMMNNKSILVYLNRLSDLLYLLARSCEKTHRKVKI